MADFFYSFFSVAKLVLLNNSIGGWKPFEECHSTRNENIRSLQVGIFARNQNIKSTKVDTHTVETKIKALANEDTLLRTHCCRHKCFPVCLACTGNICPGHKKCFWFCSERFCVRNKCFPVCAAQETSWATMCPQQCVLVCQGLYREDISKAFPSEQVKLNSLSHPSLKILMFLNS